MTAASITARYTRVQGVKTFYEANNGTGKAGTIVCLASAGRETRQFHSLMTVLDPQFRVLAFDWPGHGKTWPLPANECITSFEAYAGFALSFVESVARGEEVVFVGCGLGANVAWRLAGSLPVRAIVAMGAAARYPEIPAATLTLMDHPHISQQYAGLAHTRSLIGGAADPRAMEEILWGVRTEVSLAKKAAYGMCSGLDQRGALAAIRCPVLLIRGEDDWLIDDEAARETGEVLGGCGSLETTSLPGVGHFPMQEQPERVRDLIEHFLSHAHPRRREA